MRELVRLTLAVPGRTMYLCMHSRSRTGQMALRWRQCGALAPHLPWGEVTRLLQTYPWRLATWYRRVNDMALRLNVSEKQARASLNAARLDVGSTQIDLECA